MGTAPEPVSVLPGIEKDAEIAEGAIASTSAVHDTDLTDMQERLEALRS